MTATLNTSEVTPAPAGPPRSFLLSLAAVLGVGPFAIDMYLASLPEIGADFAAPSWTVQLTLTGYLIMLGAGQLVAGDVVHEVCHCPACPHAAAKGTLRQQPFRHPCRDCRDPEDGHLASPAPR